MKRFTNLIIFTILVLSAQLGHAGAFSTGFYGNIDGQVEATTNGSPTTNANWNGSSYDAFVQLTFSGRELSGFEFWTRLEAYANLDRATLGNNYILNPLSPTAGISPDYQGSDGNNFLFRQVQAHLQKTIKLKKGSATLALYRGQDRTDVSQPYLDFFGDVGDGDTKTGFQWNASGLWGFNTRGFILDYRSDAKDADPNTSDIHAYMIGGRLNRSLVSKTYLNLIMGITAGASQYFKPYQVTDIFSPTGFSGTTNKYFYNVAGADLAINGSLEKLGDYYFFIGAGRSYAPETYPFEQAPGIAWLGNSNSLMLISELKWSKKFEINKIDFGKIYFSAYMNLRQPRYQLYLGGGNETKYQESLYLTYAFPVKAVSLNTRLEYFHDWDLTNTQYHIWNVGDISDDSVVYKKHVDLNILLKQGFSVNIAYDNEQGQAYIGGFFPDGVNYLTATFAGESDLGRIAPQFKIVALGDTNKQVMSSGIEILLNLSPVLQFYSRYAYVSSAGYWTSDGDTTWWNAFLQLQYRTGNNSRLTLEYGDGNGTDNNFVSDKDLINGASFINRFNFRFEYWI